MQVHIHPEALPTFHKAVVTIGTFDGVHRGHRQIIEPLVRRAREIGGESVIISFHPHPRQVIRNDASPLKLLTSLEERKVLLEALGVDHLVFMAFTEAFAMMDASEYVSEFLVKRFHPHTIIMGHDHRFGRNRVGDYQLMEEMAEMYGFEVEEIDAELLEASAISSTRIREALQAGDIRLATSLLGYAYRFSGRVVHGDKRGRTIGFPTANLEVSGEDKLMPADGVYTVLVELPGQPRLQTKYSGMMNIGHRPTVDGIRHTTEVHIFGFDQDIYGELLEVSLIGRIRDEQRFSGLEALKAQLAEDRNKAVQMLKG